ncbi:MAG: cupin domain-containing protein [Hyphomicrobiaceae bacterium]
MAETQVAEGPASHSSNHAGNDGSTEKKMQKFTLRAPLLEQGRSDQTMARTDNLALRLKVYASGGENGLHTHPNEDHLFLILAGSARFYDKDGNPTDVSRNSGIMLPAGAYYRFEATSEEPLVLARVGCRVGQQQMSGRLNIHGKPMPGDSKENKQVEAIVREGAWFE